MEQHLHRKLEDTKLKWEKECVSETYRASRWSRLTSRCSQHEACHFTGPPRERHPGGFAESPLGEGGEVEAGEGHHNGEPDSSVSSSVNASVSAAGVIQRRGPL